MCFRWLKRLYHWLRRKCSRRSRGYSREISLSHRRFCTGGYSGRHGRGSFSCSGEGSVTYSRRPPPCPVPYSIPTGYPCDTGGDSSVTYGRRSSPCPVPYSIPAGYPCDTGGSVVVASGDCGLTASWDVSVGPGPGPVSVPVPVYGSAVRTGHSGEDAVPLSGGGSACHGGDLGMAGGAAAGYGYPAPLSDTLATGGVIEGPGYYGGELGYGIGGLPGPELIPAGGGCAQMGQQKCPVVVPSIKSQQCKQSSHWPPVQKK